MTYLFKTSFDGAKILEIENYEIKFLRQPSDRPITHFAIIDKVFELTFGQDHKVKGQGLIYTCVKNLKIDKK